MIRLFVALELPPAIRDRLTLLRGGIPGARWIDGTSMHLTLRFIGEVDRGTFMDVEAALSRIDAPGFTLQLRGLDQFSSGKRPRTLWAGIARNPALLHLQAKVDSALSRIGVPGDRRKFLPHVTLARLHDADRARLRRYLEANAAFWSEPFPVDSFTLYSSWLGNEAAHYRAEAEYPLRHVEAVPA